MYARTFLCVEMTPSLAKLYRYVYMSTRIMALLMLLLAGTHLPSCKQRAVDDVLLDAHEKLLIVAFARRTVAEDLLQPSLDNCFESI